MTKEQFSILMKAKHIISEQAQDAILWLQSCELKEALAGHYSFYRSAFAQRNYKVSAMVAKSLSKYLVLVDDKVNTATIYLIMACEAIVHENHTEVMNLYQQFIQLGSAEQKITINFELFMFEIFAEFKLFEKCYLFASRIINNPYIYNITIPEAVHFYTRYAMVCFTDHNLEALNQCYDEMKKIVDGNFSEETQELGKHGKYLVEILIKLSKSITKEEELEALNLYKIQSVQYIDYPTYVVHHKYEIDYLLLTRLFECNEFEFVLDQVQKFLKKSSSIRMKILFQELKIQIYKKTNNSRYLTALEELTKLQFKREKELSEHIADAYISTARSFDIQAGMAKLQKQYEYDELTKAYSRNILYQRAKDLFQRNKTATIIFMDIDNLKDVNDTYSHQAGDEYLCLFVRKLQEILPKDAMVFRYGGDEFVALLRGDDEKYNLTIVNQLRNIFSTPQSILDQMIEVRFSAGIANYPRHGRDIQEVLSCADYKMYEAKRNHNGRNNSRNQQEFSNISCIKAIK